MNRTQALKTYLTAIQARDLSRILQLFSPTATVSHPIFGDLTAAEFFPKLLDATTSDEAAQPLFFQGENDQPSSVLFFEDHWTDADGASYQSSIVLLFHWNSDSQVERLQVVFDTAPVRQRV